MKALITPPLDKGLRYLIELRVSQINGCFYCCNLHLSDARKNNVPQKKLDLLPIWFSTILKPIKLGDKEHSNNFK
ncbi:carboxymuconolactone decarboxylase family protein [Candidatus Tisiphia endosymbiont of Sialis lutaria]|uniref:carboxymuconolactone decarboxylase family protein n=1 Tax=Candidatus Tisiphia endosymbiont of Sialis lutaria TaxID=2029164 RepID=UPI003977804F